MSRCFPFPPPGYEKKAKIEDVDLLKKEKHREKKHKKEKRDKEKDNKEKKKEKSRDKKKDKAKDKTSTSEDGRLLEKNKNDNQEKLGQKKHKEKDNGFSAVKGFVVQSSGYSGDNVKDKTSTSEYGRLPEKNENENQEKVGQKEYNDKYNGFSAEKKFVVQSSASIGDKVNQKNHLVGETKYSKLAPQLGRRVDDEISVTRNLLVEKLSVTQPKSDGRVRFVAKGSKSVVEGKENANKKVDERRIDGQGIREETRFTGNSMAQNFAEKVQARVEEKLKAVEKNGERRMETKERTRENGGDEKRGDKKKNRDKEKKEKKKKKDRDKEKKKEKSKNKIEQKNGEVEKLKEIKKDNNLTNTDFMKTLQPPKDSNKTSGMEVNLGKRKEIETNGVLHDFFTADDSRYSKLPIIQSLSFPSAENGKIMEAFHPSLPSTSGTQVASINLKLENKKEYKMNGTVEALPSVSPAKPIPTPVQAKIAAAHTKPPHPDSKYLSQVYSVPKLEEEWSDISDQDWLFSSTGSQLKKPKMESSEVAKIPQVWAEAMQIDSADICALPYVIPY